MIVLGVETSCDETGLAIYDTHRTQSGLHHGLIAQVLHSQADEHAAFGGVVPEYAAREHLARIDALLEELLFKASLSLDAIDCIAYTCAPGLMGALLVGQSYAQGLALGLGIPLLGVNHLEAHIFSAFLSPNTPSIKPPFYALLASGGHSDIVEVKDFGDYHMLGSTRDDAIGEAFDKSAKLLGFDYPGGAKLAKLAKKGNDQAFPFSRPLSKSPSLDVSFSGLKTEFRYQIDALQAKEPLGDKQKEDLAASFELAVVETLLIKLRRTFKTKGALPLFAGGGVVANELLRERLQALGEEHQTPVEFPSLQFCTDNGAMVALLGALRAHPNPQERSCAPREALDQLTPFALPAWARVHFGLE